MRLYSLRYKDGREAAVEDLYFDDDRIAIDFARGVARSCTVEVWQDGALLVAIERWSAKGLAGAMLLASSAQQPVDLNAPQSG